MMFPGDLVRVDFGDDISVYLVEDSSRPPPPDEPPVEGVELESLRRWTIDTDCTPGAKTKRGGYTPGADMIVPADEAEPGAERSGTFVDVTVNLWFDRPAEKAPGVGFLRRAHEDEVVILFFGFDARGAPAFDGGIQQRQFTCEEFGDGRAVLESQSWYLKHGTRREFPE